MFRTFLALLFVTALLLAPTTAFAQDAVVPVACGDLSEEDCDFLHASRVAMMSLDSYAATVDLETSLQNLPGLPADLSWSVVSDGRFIGDPATTTRLAELQVAPPEDPMEMFTEVMGLMANIYSNTAFDLVLDVSTSDDLNALINAQPTVPVKVPTELSLPLRMVDGVVYFDVTDIGQALGDSSLQGWLGADIGTTFVEGIDQVLQQLEENPEMLDSMTLESMTANMQMNTAAVELTMDYVSVERLDDTTLNGVDVAQFVYSFDVAGFVSSPEFIELVTQQVQQQLEMQEAMGQQAPVSEADIKAITDMVPMLAPMLLSGMTWETLASIGLEDGLVYETSTSVEWDLQTVATMATAMQSGRAQRPAPGAETPYFTLDVTSTNGDFNEEFDIEAPEDAILIPLDQMESLPVM